MPACHGFRLPGGGFALVRTSGRPSGPCSSCGAAGRYACDFPLRGEAAGRTCDRPICGRCKTAIGPDRDLCRACVPLWDFEKNEPRPAAVTLALACSCGADFPELVLSQDVADQVRADWYRLHAGPEHEPAARGKSAAELLEESVAVDGIQRGPRG